MSVSYTRRIGEIESNASDDNFIRGVECHIYATKDGVTKKTQWIVPFDNLSKSDIGSNFKSYVDLTKSEGEATLIQWAKDKLGSDRVAQLEDVALGNINIHNDLALNPPRHLEAPANFSPKPTVTPSTNHQS